MRTRARKRDVRFEVIDGDLVRTVAFPDRPGYVHRCRREAFEEVARTIDERGDEGFTLETLAEATGLPSTQVNVALEFLKECGCVQTRLRRNYPASTVLFEDAMTEYYALAEGAPDE